MRIFKGKIGHLTVEEMSSHLDGYLSSKDLERVEKHLAVCSKCRREMDTIRSTVHLLRRVPRVAAPRSFAFTGAHVSKAPRVASVWAMGFATSAAALVLAVLVSLDLTGFVSEDKVGVSQTQEEELQATTLSKAGDQAPVAIMEEAKAPAAVSAPPEAGVQGDKAAPRGEEATPSEGGKGVTLWPWELALGMVTIALAAATFWVRRRARSR